MKLKTEKMSIDYEFVSFLNSFSTSELENVRFDAEKEYDNQKIHFIVDTYDIINYTLPFTDSKFSRNEDKNSLSQFTIAYEVIFSNRERFNFTLANEYRYELSYIIDNLNGKIKNFPKIKDRLLKSILLNPMDSKDIKNNFLSDNIELFTVVYIFLKHGNNVYDRLDEFLRKNLNVEKFVSNNPELDEKITEVFERTKISALTSELFDLFVEKSKMKLLSFDRDIEKYCYLENTYRDISVIDRLKSVNKSLEKHNVVFRYLSSAPRKTDKIFSLLPQCKNQSGHNTFNRNIMQLFLLNYILDNTNNVQESNKLVRDLITFKLMQKEIDTPEFDRESFFNNNIITSLNDTFSKYRKNLEKSFFFKTYLEYKKTFNDALTSYKNKNNEALLKYLRQFDDINESMYGEMGVQNNLSPLLKINQTFFLSQKFKPTKIVNNSVQIKFGKDIIRNTFHHLPYLLFIGFKEKNNLISSFYNLLDTLSSNSSLIGFKSQNFRDEFKNIITLLSNNHSSLEIQSIDFLILSYLNVITEKESVGIPDNLKDDGTNQFTKPQEEEDIISSLSQHRTILRQSLGKRKLIQEEGKRRLTYETYKSDLIQEIDYLLLWLHRRNKNFAEAIKIGQEYVHDKTKDPRIYHGIGLAFHSKAYDQIENEEKYFEIANNFNQSKLHLLKALEGYNHLVVQKDPSTTEVNLIKKQVVGVLNTIIDSNLRKIELDKEGIDTNLLLEARESLIYLKEVIENVSYNDYESLETINHTEAELEYFEARVLYHNKEYGKSLIKINHAIERSRNFMDSKFIIAERFKELSMKIDDLHVILIQSYHFNSY